MSEPDSLPVPVRRLKAASSVLLVVDLQERLMPVIDRGEQVVETARRLIACARILELPIQVTEQNPAKLGPTVAPIAGALSEGLPRHTKLQFSALIEPVRRDLQALGRPDVLLCGVETHVCVLQTALDLLDAGFRPWIVADAVASRRSEDRRLALERLSGAGAGLVSLEMAVLEMLGEAGTPRFKTVLTHLK